MNQDSQYEELARRILEDPPASWPGNTGGLRVETKSMPHSLRENLLSAARAGAQRKEVRRGLPRAAWAGGLAAAAALLVGVYVAFVGLPRTATDAPLQALVEFAVGDARSGDRVLRTGDLLDERASVRVGPQSVAVLSVGKEPHRAEVRLQAGAHVRLDQLRATRVRGTLESGAALVRVAPFGPGTSGPRTERSFVLASPTAIASVRGTRFALAVAPSGDATLTVFEGSVAFRRRWPELEELPKGLVSESPLLSAAVEIVTKAETSVAAGSESAVPKPDYSARIQRLTELAQALAHPALSVLRNRTDVTAQEKKAALTVLAQRFPDEAARASMVRRVRDAFAEPPTVTKLSEEQQDERRQAAESLDPAERQARYAKLMKELGSRKADRETFRKEVSRALGKAPQVVKLKNGKTLYGSIFGHDGKYRVFTESGVHTVDPSEIEEIQFAP